MSAPGQSAPHQIWVLNVVRERGDGFVILVVTGRLGTVSSGTLADALSQEIRAENLRLLVDLAGVDYVSSAGLSALQDIAQRLHESSGELILCALSEPVRLVFDLAGLLPAFAIEPSRAAGLARLRG